MIKLAALVCFILLVVSLNQVQGASRTEGAQSQGVIAASIMLSSSQREDFENRMKTNSYPSEVFNNNSKIERVRMRKFKMGEDSTLEINDGNYTYKIVDLSLQFDSCLTLPISLISNFNASCTVYSKRVKITLVPGKANGTFVAESCEFRIDELALTVENPGFFGTIANLLIRSYSTQVQSRVQEHLCTSLKKLTSEIVSSLVSLNN